MADQVILIDCLVMFNLNIMHTHCKIRASDFVIRWSVFKTTWNTFGLIWNKLHVVYVFELTFFFCVNRPKKLFKSNLPFFWTARNPRRRSPSVITAALVLVSKPLERLVLFCAILFQSILVGFYVIIVSSILVSAKYVGKNIRYLLSIVNIIFIHYS